MKKNDDLTVFISSRNTTCDECKEELGKSAWFALSKEKEARCLSCADLDHLFFLASGDAALTRRSRKYSTLLAVVLKWSRARRRYERQGLLVEEKALDQAEEECLADSDLRARRRKRAAERRAELDDEYIISFANKILNIYPDCPVEKASQIAQHACRKYSGRVGRTASAKQLDKKTVDLAVIAHVRHVETNYDLLLSQGHERDSARSKVWEDVVSVLRKWKGGET